MRMRTMRIILKIFNISFTYQNYNIYRYVDTSQCCKLQTHPHFTFTQHIQNTQHSSQTSPPHNASNSQSPTSKPTRQSSTHRPLAHLSQHQARSGSKKLQPSRRNARRTNYLHLPAAPSPARKREPRRGRTPSPPDETIRE